MREFLDYYYKYKIIPVVNINDFSLKEIYNQRDFFYYKLGINPHAFENKKVIEFCPGNGVNAHYLINKVKVKKIHKQKTRGREEKHLQDTQSLASPSLLWEQSTSDDLRRVRRACMLSWDKSARQQHSGKKGV